MDFFNKLSDADLCALLAEGEEGAFTEIYERYHSPLYIYAYKKLQEKQEAQDVVQDVLLALWNRRFSFSSDLSLTTYLYTAVRNKAFDIFSHKKIADKYLISLQQFLETNQTEATDALVREQQLKAHIAQEIQALPPRMREIFVLSRKERMTHAEIAEQLNISKHTVDTQIKRALRILKNRLGPLAYFAFIALQ